MWNGIPPGLAMGDATLCRRKEEGMRGFKESILRIYKQYHSGKENAITRAEFKLKHLWPLEWYPYSDRQFRQVYSQLPICTCNKGGFYPIRKEEILEYRDYLRKKAIPLFERFRRVCNAHPKLTDYMLQLDLFRMMEASDDK